MWRIDDLVRNTLKRADYRLVILLLAVLRQPGRRVLMERNLSRGETVTG